MGRTRNSLSGFSAPLDQEIEPLADFPAPLDQDFQNDPFEVVTLRRRLRLSQTEFARRFGFPVGTLRHWESGARKPRGPALALLRVIAYNPPVVMRAMMRARRAGQVKPEPGIRPPRTPFEREHPTAPDDDIDR
jgi:DNA-binding transcriptional regulator YiaG